MKKALTSLIIILCIGMVQYLSAAETAGNTAPATNATPSENTTPAAASPAQTPAANTPAAAAPAATGSTTGARPPLRGPSPQDNILTQPQNSREEALFQESLRAVELHKNKYMSQLPSDVNDYEQYGLKKRFYFKFLIGLGYGISDTMTGAPRNYDWTAHANGAGYEFGANKNKLIYDFHFMAIFKPSRERTGKNAIGYGFEVGFTHITNMKNSPGHFWGVPIHFIVQIPLHKMFTRNQDLLLVFGPGVFIPVDSNLERVHMSFVLGAEHNLVFGNGSIIMPLFLKFRFIFHRFYREGQDKASHHFYWGIEAGIGITL